MKTIPMVTNKYDWKRYWVPREGSLAFDSEGFLLPTAEDADSARRLKTDVVGFEKLVSTPCLILLGEPGIGKSYALRDAENSVKLGRPSAIFLSVNLREYADEQRLIQDVFKSEEFDKWFSQGAELHVFLDSFDECLLRLDTVASLLANQIAKLRSVERLFFRIASRTAEWQMTLEAAMELKWGKGKVAIFELAPLTKQQVLLAAAANVPDSEKFIRVQCTNQLLALLIEQKVQGALEIAKGFISRKPPRQQRRRDLALFASRLLLKHGGGDDWPKIRLLITADTSFGRALFEGASHDYQYKLSLLVRTLDESDIAGLWEWMLNQYPLENDPVERTSGMGGTVTTAWAMADIRDGLLGRLSDLGTLAACEELVRLAKKHPKFAALRYMLTRCKEQMRRNSWQPLSPRQLFKLAENRRNRFVQNADQLLDLVCDTLESLQGKLHGPTPAARFLWNDGRPMEEEGLSDWIKIELESALAGKAIVLNREVQIHIKERTDIHVDAIAIDPHTKELDRLKLIIEVKGCWHPELKTAMKTQLLGRYLTDNDCRHGIYLVGWFLCAAWSKKDSRIKRVKFTKRQDLIDCLSKQASQLSSTDNQIRSVVLDASLPWVRPRIAKGKRQPRTTARKKSKYSARR